MPIKPNGGLCKVREQIGWTARHSLADGLERFKAWIIAHPLVRERYALYAGRGRGSVRATTRAAAGAEATTRATAGDEATGIVARRLQPPRPAAATLHSGRARPAVSSRSA